MPHGYERAGFSAFAFVSYLFIFNVVNGGGYSEVGLRRGWLATLLAAELSLTWANRLILCISWTNGGNDRKHYTGIGYAV